MIYTSSITFSIIGHFNDIMFVCFLLLLMNDMEVSDIIHKTLLKYCFFFQK